MPVRGSPQRLCSTSIMPYGQPWSSIPGDAGLLATPVMVRSALPQNRQGARQACASVDRSEVADPSRPALVGEAGPPLIEIELDGVSGAHTGAVKYLGLHDHAPH